LRGFILNLEFSMKFSEMTWPEVRQIDRNRTLVLAPIAACEQHSRHLPTFTDSILCGAVADRVEANLPDRVLLVPLQWLGASDHHLPFGATLSATLDTHITMLCEILTALLDDGFPRVMILNGHGGNIDTLHVALRRLQPRYQRSLLTGASYWELAEREIADLCDGPRKSVGHACEVETSMVMHLRPDLVRTKEIADDVETVPDALRGLFVAKDMHQRTDHGAVGYPERATADKGAKILNAIVSRVTEVVHGILREALPEASRV
jgi:creatinine amidohydrolase